MSCIYCDQELINQNDGYNVCPSCGTIGSCDITEAPEWDTINTSIDQYINPYSDISTFTQKGSKSFITINNKIVNCDIYKLHVQNSYNGKQRSFDIVESLIDNTNYSQSIKNTAKILWSEITKTKKIIRGQNRLGLIACCIHYSCINYNCPRSPEDICSMFKIEHKVLNKSDKLFIELFKDNPDWCYLIYKNIDIKDFILRFCSDLEMDKIIKENTYYQLYNKCILLYDKVIDKLTSFYEPKNIASVIVYVTLLKDTKVKKKYITDKMNICYPTLNKIIKSINELTNY